MRHYLLYIFFGLITTASGQRIQNVNVSLVNSQNQGSNTQVLVRFSLSAGVSCPGYEILHSSDSLNFIQIYNYSGICGNQNTEESFNFTHGSPAIEMTNYYQISIPGFETSPVYRIYVGQQSPKPNILVFPNPVFDQEFIRLRFYNYVGAKVEGFIYNQFGNAVKSLFLDITQDQSEVNINDLQDGLYVVWLTDGNWLFRSKFIVKRA